VAQAAGSRGVTRRRAIAHLACWTLPSAAFLLLVHLVYTAYRIEVPPRLGDDARAAITARLRGALEGSPVELPAHAELGRGLVGEGPVTVQVWVDGAMRGRVDGYGATVGAAVDSAAELIPRHPSLLELDAESRGRARLKVDVAVGRGTLERRFPMLDLVTLHPGVDGIGVTVDGVEYVLLPDELIMLGVLTKKKPFSMTPDLALGLDTDKTDEVLARRNGVTGAWKTTTKVGKKNVQVPGPAQLTWEAKARTYFRVRTDAFVERATRTDGAPLALERGQPAGPEPTKANLIEAALAGGHYLVEHMQETGRYIYEVDMSTGNAKGGYSIPRHAGTTYFLAELYRISKAEFLREPIERAFFHLQELIDLGKCTGTLPDGEEFACVVDKGGKTADMGSSALGVVALAEYQRATDSKTYEPMARKLAAWILWMQRDDGSFRHRYFIDKQQRDDDFQTLYFTGEAALAMARMYVVTGEERYVRSAERALDWLVAWYDFFAGGFMYGEEHWTCIASEAIWPAVKKDSYLTFCNGYAEFLRNQQVAYGDFPSQPDLVGAYNVTPFVMPANTPAGSRTEAVISTYQLGVAHGSPEPAILRQILAAMKYTLRQQIRDDNSYAVAAKAKGLGGVTGSPIDRSVRIDFVQHVCSAMIRASELIE